MNNNSNNDSVPNSRANASAPNAAPKRNRPRKDDRQPNYVQLQRIPLDPEVASMQKAVATAQLARQLDLLAVDPQVKELQGELEIRKLKSEIQKFEEKVVPVTLPPPPPPMSQRPGVFNPIDTIVMPMALWWPVPLTMLVPMLMKWCHIILSTGYTPSLKSGFMVMVVLIDALTCVAWLADLPYVVATYVLLQSFIRLMMDARREWWLTLSTVVDLHDVVKLTKTLAEEYGIDVELLAYLSSETAMASKSVLQQKELKFKAIQWLRANRKSWNELSKLDQLTKVVALCSRVTPIELALQTDLERTATMNVSSRVYPTSGQLRCGVTYPLH